MLELVSYKVRPKNGDKKLHIFRVLMDIDDSDSYSFKEQYNSVLEFFWRVFPYGFYVNSFERHVIDYSVVKESGNVSFYYHVLEHFNHEYLSQYLNSDDEKK